jgi:hypothetical protein
LAAHQALTAGYRISYISMAGFFQSIIIILIS